MGGRPTTGNRLSLVLIDRKRRSEMVCRAGEEHDPMPASGSVTVEATRRAAKRVRRQQRAGKTWPGQVSLYTAVDPSRDEAPDNEPRAGTTE